MDCSGPDVKILRNAGVCNHSNPYCPACKRSCQEIPEVLFFAAEEKTSPDQWIRAEESTYNPVNDHFLCDGCFIAIEQSTGNRLIGPDGSQWTCP